MLSEACRGVAATRRGDKPGEQSVAVEGNADPSTAPP